MVYIDTSAAFKLIKAEPESDYLQVAITKLDLVSSRLLRIELCGNAAKIGPEHLVKARDLCADIVLISVSQTIEDAAIDLVGKKLRSLDAIHLATALSLGQDLDLLIAYDQRLLDAARSAGLKTLSPGT